MKKSHESSPVTKMNFKEFQSLNMKYYLATGGLCFGNSLYNKKVYTSENDTIINFGRQLLLDEKSKSTY